VPLSPNYSRRGPHMIRLWLTAAALLSLNASAVLAAESIGQAERDAVLAGWRKLKEIDQSNKAYQAVRKDTASTSDGKGKVARATVVLWGERKFIELSRDNTPFRQLHAANPGYSFTLGKTQPGQSDWAIQSTHAPASLSEFDRLASEPITCFWLYPLSGFAEGSAIDLVDAGKLTLTSLTAAGSEKVASFRYKVRIPERNISYDFVGTMTVDPTRHYLITGYSYGKEGDSKPFKRCDRKVRPSSGAAGIECEQLTVADSYSKSEFTFSDYEYRSGDPAKFTLSCYGLPEPVGLTSAVAARGGRGWLWALLAASVLACAVVALGYLRRRRTLATRT
jgi:hypothetical protein